MDCQIQVLRNNVGTLEECVYCVLEIFGDLVYNSIVKVELISALIGQTQFYVNDSVVHKAI